MFQQPAAFRQNRGINTGDLNTKKILGIGVIHSNQFPNGPRFGLVLWNTSKNTKTMWLQVENLLVAYWNNIQKHLILGFYTITSHNFHPASPKRKSRRCDINIINPWRTCTANFHGYEGRHLKTRLVDTCTFPYSSVITSRQSNMAIKNPPFRDAFSVEPCLNHNL